MDSITNDVQLRAALYSVYVALFEARRTCPAAFGQGDLTRMITGLMGSRPWSWRVIGITSEALKLFQEHDFKKPPKLIERGHQQDRASTARDLFSSPAPMPLVAFFEYFLERDQTVLMTVEQNKHRPKAVFPSFIPIDQSGQLFPCGTLIGYQHRKKEAAYLRKLYEEHFA